MVVTLTTDFGSKDPYVAMMKGVLLRELGEGIHLVDTTHDLGKFSVRAASFIVHSTYRYFPKGSFHLVVVDPGVGTERGIVALRTKDNHIFVGPNNGVFSPFFAEENVSSYSIFNPNSLPYKRTGRTFQGRDLFSPLLSDIAKGKVKLGEEFYEEPVILSPPVKKVEKDGITFEVLYIDSFGNAITNLRYDDISGRSFIINIGDASVKEVVASYQDGKGKEPFLVEGGFGLLEIAIRKESASEVLGLQEGRKLKLKWLS